MNYKKKKSKKFIITLSIIILVVVISFVFSTNGKLTFLQKFSKDISNSIVNVLNKPIRIIQDKIRKNDDKEKIYNTYELLSANEESIKLVLAENENLKNKVNELENINNINEKYEDYTNLYASVVKRNVGYWNNIITIDKGSKSGIEENMAVITSKGLVGITTNVSNYYSDVKLLTSDVIQPKISVQVKTNEKYVPGIFDKYNKDNNTFVIEGISEYKSIENGSYVYTTSYNENIPSGILIGQVISVKKDKFDLSKIVEVKSDVDFDNLRYVDVLIKGWLHD